MLCNLILLFQLVKLLQSVDSKIIGTVPKAFRYHTLGYVDAYIMFRTLA
ncbi:MAG: hypothetical protein KGQ36_02895 [Rickettsiales bacterium]|nr:hypothetical protein [Rickettsiales bacterium]